MNLSRRHCLVTGAAALAGPVVHAQPADKAGFALVLARLRAEYLSQGTAADAARQLANMAPGGLWPDVDYADQSVGDWHAMPHLARLRAIALASQQPTHALYGAPAARQALNTGLRAWLVRKPVSTNWWHNTIGQQLVLMPLLVLARDLLDADVARDATALLQDPGMVPPEQATGQNLVWYATEQLVRGALRSDAGDLAAASTALQSTLRITGDEGIQADYSFHQHGPQLYSGGYGLGFLQDSARTAAWLAGTPWAFAAGRLELLADYALQGIVPLIRGPWLDWGARGREFTRDERVPRPQLVLAALKQLQVLVPTRAQALGVAVGQLGAGGAGATGNRHYWRSDFMVHQTARGYLSLKLVSARTVGTESGNGENLLGYWLPFGVTYLLRRGDEYDGLPPVWDWSALPGLTAPAETPVFTGYQRHGQRFVGGLSDGTSGLAVMVLDKLQTTARRAWFFNGDMVVALGAAINSTHPQAVSTTLNQTRWVGPAQTDAGPALPNGGNLALAGRRWVWHDGISYLLLDAPSATLRLEARRQGINTINPALGRQGAEARVCTLTMGHGVRPVDAHYAYGVWLGATRPEEASRAPTPDILANSAALQAVRHAQDGLVQAVFHREGTVVLDAQQSLRVDAACLVQARPKAGSWQIDVSDPARLRPTVRLQLLRGGQVAAAQELALPAGDNQAPQARWSPPG